MRGLFLDMDGTVADSLAVLRIVYRRFLDEHGIEGTDAGFERVNGVPLRVVIEELRREHGLESEPRVLFRRFVVLIGEAYQDVPAMPGAHEIVHAARDLGMAVALVTSAAEDFARGWLERSGLAPSFDAVVGGDTVERGKPHPEPYLLAVELTGADASRSIAVEDSPAGARAAVDAGLATFVLESGTTDGLDWPPVSGRVTSLTDVPLEVDRVRG